MWISPLQQGDVLGCLWCRDGTGHTAALPLLGTGFEFAADWGLLCCGTCLIGAMQIFVPITVHRGPIAAENSLIFWARVAVFVPTWQMEHGAYQMRTLIKWTSVKFWWLVGIVARQRHREKDRNWNSWIHILIHQWSLYFYYYLFKQQARNGKSEQGSQTVCPPLIGGVSNYIRSSLPSDDRMVTEAGFFSQFLQGTSRNS